MLAQLTKETEIPKSRDEHTENFIISQVKAYQALDEGRDEEMLARLEEILAQAPGDCHSITIYLDHYHTFTSVINRNSDGTLSIECPRTTLAYLLLTDYLVHNEIFLTTSEPDKFILTSNRTKVPARTTRGWRMSDGDLQRFSEEEMIDAGKRGMFRLDSMCCIS